MYLHIFGPRALINHNEYKFYSCHGTDYRAKLGLGFLSICPRWFCFHPMWPLLSFFVEFAVAQLVACPPPRGNQCWHASPQSVQLVVCMICHRGSLVRFIVAACFLGLLDFLVSSARPCSTRSLDSIFHDCPPVRAWVNDGQVCVTVPAPYILVGL